MTEMDVEDVQENPIRPAGGFTPEIETRSVSNVDDVNMDQRIITVIAVPYEQPTTVPFQQSIWNEVFSRSAFKGIESRIQNPLARRIPATACLQIPAPNHSGGQLVGRVIEAFPDREQGLITDIKISRTDQGDATLELARDGALSPSVGFMVKNRLDESLDRVNKVRRINRAFLDHLAFVGEPAYPGAKVLAVRSEGGSDLSRPVTPNLDDYLDDPIFQWSRNRLNR
jgi:hypothetical protein